MVCHWNGDVHPSDARRKNTSLWRQNDVATSFWRHHNVIIASCVRRGVHFDNIPITGCTVTCQNDNFRCSLWWKFHKRDNISVSIVKNPVLSYTLERRKDAAQYKHTLCIGRTRPTSSEIWAWKSVIASGEQGTFKSVFELLNLAPFECMGEVFFMAFIPHWYCNSSCI